MLPRPVSRLLVAVLLAGGTGCAGVDVIPATGPAVEAPRPVYEIGQRWVRTDGVWELVYVGEDVYVFTDAHRSEIVLSRDLLPMRFLDRQPGSRRVGHVSNEPFSFHPAPRLDWPLSPGKRGASKVSWSFLYDEIVDLPSPRGGTYTRTYTFRKSVEATFAWTVEAYERVRVPAGTFDAYRLRFTVTADDPREKNAPSWWMTTWYAPAIRQFVAADGRNIELLRFRLAAVDAGQLEPLAVVLREPQDGHESLAPDVRIVGRVAAGAGVASVTIGVNGVQTVTQAPSGAPTGLTLDSTVALREGRNVVIVTATDVGGRTRQEARTVFHDPTRQRGAAERAQARARAARQAAERADAARHAASAWNAAELAIAQAEAAVRARDYAGAERGFAAALAEYERATTAATARMQLTGQQTAAREAAERARAAAEAAEAGQWAAAMLRQATVAAAEAAALARDERFERATEAYGRAEAAYRAAEQQALVQAAASASAERERQDARRRQREAVERQARLAEQARASAVAAGAERHAPAAFGRAGSQERVAAAALASGDAVAAQDRYAEAERAYREAATAAQAEVERAAQAERDRAEAARALAAAAQARAAAEQVAAGRFAAEAAAQATARERAAGEAAARGDHREAARAGDEARQAWERAAAAARGVTAAPLRFAFEVPAQVERAELQLDGRVASARGVARVFVTLNGDTVWRRDGAASDLAVQVPLTLREGHNTIVVTAADAQGRIEQDVRVVSLVPPMPLALEIRYPAPDERISQASSVVAAVVGSSRGVTEVRVTLNGQDVHRQSERRPQRAVVVAAPVTLTPGANTIVVTAVEDGGATRRATRIVTLDLPATGASQVAGAAAGPEPERWAVVVGVGAYDSAAIPRLSLTTADAEAIYRTLVEEGGFKRENVLLFTDRTARKPTLRTLKWALGTFLARSARKSDTVVIFFAGHGAPEVDVGGRERDGLSKYLVPLDADPDDLYATGLPMDEFETIFSRIEAERVIVFLDACYSGAAGGRTFSSGRTRGLNVDDGFLQRLVQSRGRVIVTAARASEVSVEVQELGHGLFTYYLVRGLKGAADANADRVVTLQELYQYVEQEVTRHSRAIGANQHPTMKGELEGLLPLVRIRR